MEKKIKQLANNKKAFHDYFITERFEAGIELFGTEVKSIRQGRVNLKDSYASIDKGEIFLYNMHISPYENGNIFNRDPLRPKKLLMHKREILKLFGLVSQDGFSLIPTSVYLKGQHVKVELCLAKGKKLYDKRDAIGKRESQRRIDRAIKEHNR